MPKKPLIIDFSEYDLNNVVADIEEIRRYNMQRFEMEQLTAICFEDAKARDLRRLQGPPPGRVLGPRPHARHAAHARRDHVRSGRPAFQLLCQQVRFNGRHRRVRRAGGGPFPRAWCGPGDRFIIAVRLLKSRRTIMTSEFQCFVNQNLVCEGILKGVALPLDQLSGTALTTEPA